MIPVINLEDKIKQIDKPWSSIVGMKKSLTIHMV